ncbi:hypothetical protein [Amycolatopsis sp. NPDC003731]
MDTIDAAKAVELIELAVEQNGADYVDPNSDGPNGCFYVSGGECSCIVGTAYGLAGATVEQVLRMDDMYGGPIEYMPDDVLPIDTAPGAIAVFAAAQEAQDNGKTWGEALAAARKVAGVAEVA